VAEQHENALDTADRLVDLVRNLAASAEVEVTVHAGEAALTRFANNFIHQNMAEDVQRIMLRVAIDGRTASGNLDGPPTEDRLRKLADDVLLTARVRPPDPDWPGLAPPAPASSPEHWDEGTSTATAEERARRVAGFIAAADELTTAGYCSTDIVRVGFANSAGQRLQGRATSAQAFGIARTDTSDSSGRAASQRLAEIDGFAIGRAAAERARASAAPVDLEPGRYEVVLEPVAVADLLTLLFLYGFNARAVEEGRSFVRLGEHQFDESISMRDDASDPRQVGIGFDAEGTPKRLVDVVERGLTTAVLHTRRTAAKAGTQSTGHAIAGAETYGALPENMVFEAGMATREQLMEGVTRGLLVSDFWYTRVLDPRTTVVTGLTRNGVWLVEGGRVVRPVKNLRFTQAYAEALAPGAVLGVGRERELVPDALGAGMALVPRLRLASWNFTGGAQG
jgi:predicted Zn-dependent protease